MSLDTREFSPKSRERALRSFREEKFDLLVIGGGITGAGVARDACSRGLKVALVEKNDFAWGGSSRSSKLIHGGLRYLENFELHLVFEALAERALLLKTAPHMVRPLPFYLPVYHGDPHGRFTLDIGLWLYDLLALFRTPGFHRSLGRKKMLKEIPFLKHEGLKGGFRYYDASMWDDVLAVETLRDAHQQGAQIASYVEAVEPLWEGDRIRGFKLRDRERPEGDGALEVRASKVVVCAGPWTDHVGRTLSSSWKRWLNPSKGVHLVFDLKRIPVPGAMVMSHPEDGRISFVIPRPDFGAGVTIVGTTDGPAPAEPEKASVERSDVRYLLELLTRYFPDLKLSASDILSAYVGVRPLMGATSATTGSEGQSASGADSQALQKVSREHYIGSGPGGTVLVAGGKYTTHRTMAQEIVDYALKTWADDRAAGRAPAPSRDPGPSQTLAPVTPAAVRSRREQAVVQARSRGFEIPVEILSRYGAEALELYELMQSVPLNPKLRALGDPDGFPWLEAQLRYAIRTGMVMHLEDFYLRRAPFYASRADHGLPWAEGLSEVWAEELGRSVEDAHAEVHALRAEIARRESWRSESG